NAARGWLCQARTSGVRGAWKTTTWCWPWNRDSARCALVVAAMLSACGNRPSPPPAERKDAASADAEAAVDLAARPLGLADFEAYSWRRRAGQPAFRLARAAEDRGDWPAVIAACKDALAADAGHLEAAWLLAIGHAKVGQLDQVAAPLQQAAAGEFP